MLLVCQLNFWELVLANAVIPGLSALYRSCGSGLRGSIHIDLPNPKRTESFLLQDPALFDRTVWENVGYGCMLSLGQAGLRRM